MGESAIDKLIDALIDLRAQPLPEDALLGRTHYTVGLISGGVAPNVVSPHAEAEVMFRTVGAFADLQPALDALTPRVRLETLLEVPAVRLTTVDGFKTMSFPFATDVPFLDAWGKPLLFGPGSILRRPHRPRARLDRRAREGRRLVSDARAETAGLVGPADGKTPGFRDFRDS